MERAPLSQSLTALESRLRRIEYQLTGRNGTNPVPSPAGKDEGVKTRITRLEQGLNVLATQSPAIRTLLHLQSVHPELFHPPSHSQAALSMHEQLSIINAAAPSFQETASRLTMLKELPIPETSASTQLISLTPRIERLQRNQQTQRKEIQELRSQSAKAIERWYELGVLGTGECWAEWEGRLEAAEKQIRRRERGRQLDEQNETAYQD